MMRGPSSNREESRASRLTRIRFEPDARGPLDGIRVVDLSRLVVGNMVSLQLADYGADVVKVEKPGKGDPLRDWTVQGVPVHWKVYGRNKRSLALDLHDVGAMGVLRALLANADVLVENFRPGTLESMELAPESLHRMNPGLVILRCSAWGQDGPYRDRPGFGTLVEGVSGFADKNGYADRPPVLPPLSLADMVAGLHGFGAVMTAIHARHESGRGQVIDLALLDALLSILGGDAAAYRVSGRTPERMGSRTESAAPRNVFRTRDDRWIAVTGATQSMTERLYMAVGRADILQDPRLATNAARLANVERAEEPVASFIAARTLSENLAVFEEAEVTAAPVYSVAELLDDPHVVERGTVVDVPDAQLGSVPMHSVVARFSATPGAIRRPAPEIGQHNEEILRELGFAGWAPGSRQQLGEGESK